MCLYIITADCRCPPPSTGRGKQRLTHFMFLATDKSVFTLLTARDTQLKSILTPDPTPTPTDS